MLPVRFIRLNRLESQLFCGASIANCHCFPSAHPEHDLLFVATQVARAAGLKNPKGSVQYVKSAAGNMQAKELKVQESCTLEILKAASGRRWADSWLFTEGNLYRMLMRGGTDKATFFFI
ncbi:hypothetical protein EYC95_04265 [Pseudomonas sp. BGI-2]|nr:hypothetical protein EYC95_04265 [Pseudomonas sp. BGI-2]